MTTVDYISVGITLANMILFVIYMIFAIPNLIREIKRGIKLDREIKELDRRAKEKQSLQGIKKLSTHLNYPLGQ